jgi:hypothetical protein
MTGVYNGSHTKIYINGLLSGVSNQTISGRILANNEDFHDGGN